MKTDNRLVKQKVKFKDWDCIVAYAQYGNGRTAIQLMAEDDGQPIAIASVNLPDEPMEADEIAIKDYSENEGMLDCLVEAKIVSHALRFVRISQWVTVPICHLMGVLPVKEINK
jgi:hypothetical protein